MKKEVRYMNYSPLRYPGGKTKIAPLVNIIMGKAGIKNGTYIEPFAGGGGVALSLLLSEKVNKIIINDFDRAVYAFWYAILNETNVFVEMIRNTTVSVDEWKKQKEVFNAKENADLIKLGFATFFLNRTNRSGILKAGPIGGYDQSGNYSLDVRFNKEELIKRIVKISTYKNRIAIYNLEINDFFRDVLPLHCNNSFVYFDPPYYVKGHELYVNFFTPNDHINLANQILKLMIDWMVTYDDVSEIKSMYIGKEQKSYDLNYSLANKGKKSEIIILSRKLWPSEKETKELNINLR